MLKDGKKKKKKKGHLLNLNVKTHPYVTNIVSLLPLVWAGHESKVLDALGSYDIANCKAFRPILLKACGRGKMG